MTDPWLIFETSGRVGRVGLAVAGRVVADAALDETRRHARDLAPTAGRLIADAGLSPNAIRGVAVSVGPGSFTGLRVGIISAKAFAYAAGCELIAVPTFEAIAIQTPADATVVDVIADALRGHVYVQRFQNDGATWQPTSELQIRPVEDWLATAGAEVRVGGPGIAAYSEMIPPAKPRTAETQRLPAIESIWRVAQSRLPLTRNEIAALEPLYLRGSSAEEKAKAAK